MKKLLPLLLAGAVAVLGYFLWAARLPPFDGHPEPVEVAFGDLAVELDGARVEGTAHYPVRISQLRRGRFGRPDRTWWLYPLFPKGDTEGRAIRAMVASPNEPDRIVSFEDMTVEAWALPPAAGVTPEVERALIEEGYSFEDDYVLLEVFVEDPPEGG